MAQEEIIQPEGNTEESPKKAESAEQTTETVKETEQTESAADQATETAKEVEQPARAAEQTTETAKETEQEVKVVEKTKDEADTVEQTAKITKDEADTVEQTASAAEQKPAKKRRSKIAWIVAAVVLAAAYAGPAWFYAGHFYPGTTIDRAQVGNMNLEAATETMDALIDEFELKVFGRDLENDTVAAELESLRAKDIDLKRVDSFETAERILGEQKPILWFANIMKEHAFDDRATLAYDEDALQELMSAWDVFDEAKTSLPVDAHLSSYMDDVKGYMIVPETAGNRPDAQRAKGLIAQAVYAGESKVDLDEMGCYPKARILEDNKTLNWNLETANRWIGTEVTYDWNGSKVVVDAKVVKDWVSTAGSRAHLDEEAVKQFVTDRAAENDTYGRDRVIHSSRGTDITVSGKRYGWRTDRSEETKQLLSMIHEGKKETREPVYLNTAWVKGTEDDIGDSYVEIDLGLQHLYLFVDGKVVLETDFVSGNMSNGNATPPGIFGMTYKTTDAILRGADYATPVKYWMPFNGNVGMHDATWRRAFGGEIYLTSGSHGCVNLPLSAAKEIYSYVSKGFPVICYY